MSKTLKQRQLETGRTLALNGKAWRDLRAYVLAESPLCEICDARGLTVAATEVDHSDNDPTNNAMANLVSLCGPCHSLKTQADLGKRVHWGCDMNGHPLDPRHPWHTKRPAPPGDNVFLDLVDGKSRATDDERTAPPKLFYC